MFVNLTRQDWDKDSESGGWWDEAKTSGGIRDSKSLLWTFIAALIDRILDFVWLCNHTFSYRNLNSVNFDEC